MGCGRQRQESVDVLDRDKLGRKDKIYVAKSFSLSVVDWFHVASLYVPYILSASFVVAISCLIPSEAIRHISKEPQQAMVVAQGWAGGVWAHVSGLWYAYSILVACLYWAISAKPNVYLMDYSVFEAPPAWRLSREQLIRIMSSIPAPSLAPSGAEAGGTFTPESISFMTKLLNSSGTGEATAWPPGTVRMLNKGQVDPSWRVGETIQRPDTTLAAARATCETVLVGCMESLLARNPWLKAKDIDFLIINCSLFVPTPSLCSIIARRFDMRPTVRSYNLGGMGCSASLVSIDLAKQLLQNRPHSLAVVLSTEEITQSLYTGNDRAMLVQNTLFRVGGAAMLLSNRPMDAFKARYKLLYTVRVQDTSESGHGAVYQQEDAGGTKGIFLSKEITSVAGAALKQNLTILGAHVLPIREQIKVVASLAARKVVEAVNRTADALDVRSLPFATVEMEATGESKPGVSSRWRYAKGPVYVPDFKKAIKHFCIHAGGRAVIEGIEKNLSLERWMTAPSRATLFHWGNTSSSSIWYELRYCEGERGYWRGTSAEGRKKIEETQAGAPAYAAEVLAKQTGGAHLPPLPHLASSSSLDLNGCAAAAAGELSTPVRNAKAAAAALHGSPSGTPSEERERERGDKRLTRSAATGGLAQSISVSDLAGSPSARSTPTTASTSTASTSASTAAVGPHTAVTSEAVPEGWDPAQKWHLPDYEARHVAPGDRVLQIAFGSGFKCNSAVWLRLS